MLFRYRGVLFGYPDGELLVSSVVVPTLEVRSDYKDRIGRDGVNPSRDYLGSGAWQIAVSTNGDSLADTTAFAGRLESAWKAPAGRGNSAPQPLDYSNDEGATWSRVYGRPGKFAPHDAGLLSHLGGGAFDLEFVQTDPNHYSAAERQAIIDGSASNVGGLIAPLVAPITTVSTGQARAGVLQNDGDLASPARVRFYGPSTNPMLTTEKGYTIGYVGALAYDQWVELNAWDSTVKLNSGASVAGRMDRRTRISRLSVPPGRSEWVYKATDVSGTSRAVIYWRDSSSFLR